MDSGTARVAGYDVATETKKVRSAIGVTGQFASVDELLSGRENLQLMADLHHLKGSEGKNVVEHLLQRFDLEESADKRSSTYSGGMRRKLDLAMTLVDRPQIIFLDEPTTGLEPRSRRTMWNIVRELVADGMTIFPHHPVPRGSRPARRQDRRARPGQTGRRRHSRAAQAPDPRWPRATAVRRRRAAGRRSPRADRLHSR
jgi:ABC-type Na+ transport system ATPase subunit NatA